MDRSRGNGDEAASVDKGTETAERGLCHRSQKPEPTGDPTFEYELS